MKTKAVSDGWMLTLWRRVVRRRWHELCAICGAPSETHALECHHIIPRRTKVSRYNPDNGILLCKECHRKADSLAGRKQIEKAVGGEITQRLMRLEQINYKQHLLSKGITNAEFIRGWQRELMAQAIMGGLNPYDNEEEKEA